MPFLSIKTDGTKMGGKPQLTVWSRGDLRKIVPRQTVFSFKKPPDVVSPAAYASLARQPQPTVEIKSYSQNLSRRPVPAGSVQGTELGPCAIPPAKQPFTASHVQRFVTESDLMNFS